MRFYFLHHVAEHRVCLYPIEMPSLAVFEADIACSGTNFRAVPNSCVKKTLGFLPDLYMTWPLPWRK
jgi:hypothetical protein